MRKTYLVMKQELITTFTRTSFLLVAFVLPITVVLVVSVVNLLQASGSQEPSPEQDTLSNFQLMKEGFVDQADLIHTLPKDLQGYLIPFHTEDQALQAMEAGEITAYYVIPENYLAKGEVDYVFPNDRSFTLDSQKWVIELTLNLNLLDGDLELANQSWNPIRKMDVFRPTNVPGAGVEAEEDCSQPGTACESNELVRMMPAILVLIFFIAFMFSSNLLFESIGKEKENRTIEILMMLVQPRQLLLGKTAALGIAGLAHTVVWLTSIYILLNTRGAMLSLPENFRFPTRIVAWGVLFFIGGFGLYASLMAGAGALATRIKEATIASYVVLSPLLLGYMFGILAPLVGETGSNLLVFLSIFPLTSPVVMVMRLTDHLVPLWQLILSLLLLVATAYYTIRLTAAMFRAQNLLSGESFSPRRYLAALAGGF